MRWIWRQSSEERRGTHFTRKPQNTLRTRTDYGFDLRCVWCVNRSLYSTLGLFRQGCWVFVCAEKRCVLCNRQFDHGDRHSLNSVSNWRRFVRMYLRIVALRQRDHWHLAICCAIVQCNASFFAFPEHSCRKNEKVVWTRIRSQSS